MTYLLPCDPNKCLSVFLVHVHRCPQGSIKQLLSVYLDAKCGWNSSKVRLRIRTNMDWVFSVDMEGMFCTVTRGMLDAFPQC